MIQVAWYTRVQPRLPRAKTNATEVACTGRGLAHVPIPAREKVRRHTAPVEHLQRRPMQPYESKIPLLEAARGSAYPQRHVRKPAGFAQSAQQIEILEQSDGAESADLLVCGAPDEDPGISI